MNLTVKIAQDALNQLRAGALIPTQQAYLKPTRSQPGPHHILTGADLKTTECIVCAKGALVAGYMLNKPTEKLGEFWDRAEELSWIFSYREWERIENVFECRPGQSHARAYCERYKDARERLEAILENLIRNSGKFIPEQDLK